MRIDKEYLAKILNSRKFYSRLKEAGLFTYETDKEAGFIVIKELERKSFEISRIKKGLYNKLSDPRWDPAEDIEENVKEDSYFALGIRLDMYEILGIHFHSGEGGPIVPSISFDTPSGIPEGDLDGLRDKREHIRKMLGYDVKPIMGIAKMRNRTQIDMLILQERTDGPLGFGDLLEVENALQGFDGYESMQDQEELYSATQQVVQALRETGLYSAELIRYRSGRPLREDLDKLTAFEFNEVKLQFGVQDYFVDS